MLKIRSEQFETLQQAAETVFVRRTVEYLQKEHADLVVQITKGTFRVKELPYETLHEMTRNGIARAREYGISWQSKLVAFVALVFATAPNFDDHPLVHQILQDEKVPPNSRIDELWERTSDQDWEMVKRSYDANAWNLKPQGEKR
jgi:hypothetical protein